MNTRAKGARHERAVADYLRGQGYSVERGFWRPGWQSDRGPVFCAHDLFSAFDLVAIRPPNDVRFVQVTAGGGVAVRRAKAFKAWPSAEVWEHLRAGIYRIHRADGTTALIDVKLKEEHPHET